MTNFFLVRHGETDWSLNEKHKLAGEYRDLPSLTHEGILQADKVSNNLKHTNSSLIISSPYTRALQTAAIISKNMNLNISVEFDLREWQPDINLNIRDSNQLNKAINDYTKANGIYPIGTKPTWESKKSIVYRVKKVLEKYLNYAAVIVVSHEQVIKSLTKLEKVSHCSIHKLEYDLNLF